VQWTAVANPTAGRGRTRKLLPRLAPILAARGVELHVAMHVDDGRRVASDAFARGHGVIACGGDGTVTALARIAADAGAPLAIVPTGAGNDLARHLGLDRRRPLDALALLDEGRIGRIDLGRAEAAGGTVASFTTVANAGFDAEANRWANDVKWAGGTSLYVLAMLRTLAVYRPQPFRVRVDDASWEGDGWLVAIGNSRYYAGGMMITPGAEIDDGLLDVCILGASPTTELLWRFPRVFRGTHVALEKVVTLRGERVEIEAPGAALPLELWASGEHVGPLPANLTLARGALQVLVPVGAPVHTAPLS
jgi:diacylglycerol kinase (ATP)